MGRIDKALERIKSREEANRTASQRPRTYKSVTVSGSVDGFYPDDLTKKVKAVRFDYKSLGANRIITPDMDPGVRTAYKMLRTRILQSMRSNQWQSLAVTSATQGEGKTITAINLAISLAGDVNHSVCLVDLDIRHTNIAKYLGLNVKCGISDCLQGNVPLQNALLKTDIDRLFILPNYKTEINTSEILSSPQMKDVTQRLNRDPSTIIIYDMPPILAADDMLAFARFTDAILLVVAEGATLRTDVMKTCELLGNLNVIGTMLNRSNEKTASYY